jgi:hypothetical protein
MSERKQLGQRTVRAIVGAAIIVFTCLLAVGNVLAQQTSRSVANICPVNGCGPDGWMNSLVPNSVAGCSFKSSCDRHDQCYSKCLPCHSFSDDDTCQGVANKVLRRAKCDTTFMLDLIEASGVKPVCLWWSGIYHAAVVKLGDKFHKGTGPLSAAEIARRSAEFEDALKEAISKAPPPPQ